MRCLIPDNSLLNALRIDRFIERLQAFLQAVNAYFKKILILKFLMVKWSDMIY